MTGPPPDHAGGTLDGAFAARLLDERTRRLAARRAEGPALPTVDHVVFTVGSARFALPLEHLAGVVAPVPVGPLPGAPAGLLGVARIQGRMTGVVDPGIVLGPAPVGAEAAHFLVLRRTPPVALAVTRVVGVVPVAIATEATSAEGPVARSLRLALSAGSEPVGIAVLSADHLLASVLPVPVGA